MNDRPIRDEAVERFREALAHALWIVPVLGRTAAPAQLLPSPGISIPGSRLQKAALQALIEYRPMLAVSAAKPPVGAEFDFEVKFDGFRCGAIVEAGRLKLLSRQSTNVTGWFPELAELPSDVSGSDVLLDGEVIVGDGSVESFNVLLKRARLRGRSTPNALPVSFVAFDLLWHDGADLTQRPLEQRRKLLRAIVTETSRIAISRVFTDGPALLTIAAAHDLEGIVAKDRRSVYEVGQRSRAWLKTKVPGIGERHEWHPN